MCPRVSALMVRKLSETESPKADTFGVQDFGVRVKGFGSRVQSYGFRSRALRPLTLNRQAPHNLHLQPRTATFQPTAHLGILRVYLKMTCLFKVLRDPKNGRLLLGYGRGAGF